MIITGIDEAGRGALIGNVVAAAVILPESYDLPWLDDSKKLSAKRRAELFIKITQQAQSFAISSATPKEIDELNIHNATLLAMKRAVESLSMRPSEVLVDGKFVPQLSIPCRAIIGGDGLEAVISAASILAKVTRDHQLIALDQRFPQYGFAKHKGYGTKAHLAAIKKYGILPEHRLSFAPVKNCQSLFEFD